MCAIRVNARAGVHPWCRCARVGLSVSACLCKSAVWVKVSVDLRVCVPLGLLVSAPFLCLPLSVSFALSPSLSPILSVPVSVSLSLLLTRANAHTRPVQFVVAFLATCCAARQFAIAWSARGCTQPAQERAGHRAVAQKQQNAALEVACAFPAALH